MPFDQFDLIFQFCLRVAAVFAVSALAIKLSRVLARPRTTYGDGLPERRARKRFVPRDPAPVGLSEVASTAAACSIQ
jgi:hypothetical protein